MFCDFRKAFGLDPEYNKQLEESMQEAEKKALKEKWCCTCEYYIPVDPNLPGFVVAYPECEKGRDPMQSCEEYRRKGYAIRNSSWADRIRERFMRKEYRDNGTICKLLVTGTCINYSVYISSFKGKYSGGLGDFYYDIKFIIAREIKIYTTKELKIGTSSKTQRPASKKSNKKSTTGSKTTTYTIKSGDTLSRIAQKKLGKASRYPEIYKLNKSKIEAAAKKHGRKSSNNGHWIYPGTKLTIPKK